QNLYPQTLEQIRLLSNFETTKEKILQIILVGQPELMARLELPELRQLKQRIGIVCTIPPMTAANTRSYIRTRLRLGGARDLGIFTEDALDRIAEYAAGIPRVVSTICDHCLLIGYADQTRRIDVDIVDQAIAYLNAGVRPRETRRRSVPSSSQSARIVARRRARRQMSPLGWGLLGTSAAVVAAGAMLAVFQPELFPQAMDASSNHLHDLARTVRSLLGRLASSRRPSSSPSVILRFARARRRLPSTMHRWRTTDRRPRPPRSWSPRQLHGPSRSCGSSRDSSRGRAHGRSPVRRWRCPVPSPTRRHRWSPVRPRGCRGHRHSLAGHPARRRWMTTWSAWSLPRA